jgi:hypothetical protein
MFSFFQKTKSSDKEVIHRLLSFLEKNYRIQLTEEKEHITNYFDSASDAERAVQILVMLEVIIGYDSLFANLKKLTYELENKKYSEIRLGISNLYQEHGSKTLDNLIKSILEKNPKSSFSKGLLKGSFQGADTDFEDNFINRVYKSIQTYNDVTLLGFGPQTVMECFRAELIATC